MDRRSLVVTLGQPAWRRLHQRAQSVSVARLAGMGPWLVLAPHPDDESLGCGAMLATLIARGDHPHVAFLTDGSGSHAPAPRWSAARLIGARRREAAHALRALGSERPPLLLNWLDGHPPAPGSPMFRRTSRGLIGYCRRNHIRRIAVTWGGEPHCDHEAAFTLARAVGLPVHSYLVWGWTLANLAVQTARHRALSVNVARGRARQRRAIACHRTQTGTRVSSAGDAFRLPRAMIRLADRPRMILLEEPRHAT